EAAALPVRVRARRPVRVGLPGAGARGLACTDFADGVMRLGLSSAAAADADIVALLAACARRGLGVLELCDEDDHGVTDSSTARAAAVVATDFGVGRAAYRVTRAPDAAATPDSAAGPDPPALPARGALSERIQTAGTLAHA